MTAAVLLDVVVTRDDSPISVDVINPGFSDHRLVRWSFGLNKPAPTYETITDRPFRLRNDLCCVGWGVKLYSLSLSPMATFGRWQVSRRTATVSTAAMRPTPMWTVGGLNPPGR